MRSKLGRSFLSLAAIGLLTAGLLGGWWASSDLRKAWCVASVMASLETTQRENHTLLMAELDALGAPGLEALVDLLGSRNRMLAQAAHDRLLANIEHWRGLPIEQSTPRAESLAQCLADRAGRLDPRGAMLAKQITLELLSWPNRSAATTLVVNCEKVLRLNDENTPPVSAAVIADAPTNEKLSMSSHEPSRPAPVTMELPGGGLPIDIATIAPTLREQTETPRALKVVDPEPLTDEPPRHLRPPYATPLLAPTDDPPPPPPEQFQPDLTPVKPLEVESTDQLQPTIAVEALRRSFDGVESFELMPLLHDTEADLRQQAEAELRQRGFTDRHLELGRLLTSPDPGTRLEFVSLLPRLSAIDPRPWLIRLSQDPDPRVRRAALSVMATTRDPLLLDRARADGKRSR